MRFDGRADLAMAAWLGLALSPCLSAVAMANPQMAWLCTGQGPRRSPAPGGDGLMPCHACTCVREDDDESAG